MEVRLELPEFTNLLIDNPGSILIIEDAEEILVTRESGRNSAISTLLNLSDGLLGESLGIQIICTFNTNITEIDLALLRKGRLKSYYEFHPLTIEKSNNLLKTINKNNSTEKPLTLSEIFHFNDPEVFNVKENQIGFVSH
ncbi:MAG: AAA family ATPase [Leptospiraceae bacterium]|nr:AAA family ATPase [Leptospiraceae bacterium]